MFDDAFWGEFAHPEDVSVRRQSLKLNDVQVRLVCSKHPSQNRNPGDGELIRQSSTSPYKLLARFRESRRVRQQTVVREVIERKVGPLSVQVSEEPLARAFPDSQIAREKRGTYRDWVFVDQYSISLAERLVQVERFRSRSSVIRSVVQLVDLLLSRDAREYMKPIGQSMRMLLLQGYKSRHRIG